MPVRLKQGNRPESPSTGRIGAKIDGWFGAAKDECFFFISPPTGVRERQCSWRQHSRSAQAPPDEHLDIFGESVPRLGPPSEWHLGCSSGPPSTGTASDRNLTDGATLGQHPRAALPLPIENRFYYYSQHRPSEKNPTIAQKERTERVRSRRNAVVNTARTHSPVTPGMETNGRRMVSMLGAVG